MSVSGCRIMASACLVAALAIATAINAPALAQKSGKGAVVGQLVRLAREFLAGAANELGHEAVKMATEQKGPPTLRRKWAVYKLGQDWQSHTTAAHCIMQGPQKCAPCDLKEAEGRCDLRAQVLPITIDCDKSGVCSGTVEYATKSAPPPSSPAPRPPTGPTYRGKGVIM